MKLRIALFLSCLPFLIVAQNPNKKTMDHEVYDEWNQIGSKVISNDGNFVCYQAGPEAADQTLHIFNTKTKQTQRVARGIRPIITNDSRYVIFKIKPQKDSIRISKLKKVKKEALTKDSLGIYDLKTGKLEKIARVKSYKVPKEWDGYIAYQLEVEAKKKKPKKKASKLEKKKEEMAADSTKVPAPKVKAPKKETKKSGSKLVLRKLDTGAQDTFKYVLSYVIPKKGTGLFFVTTGDGKAQKPGVYRYDFTGAKPKHLHRQKGTYKNLVTNEEGDKVAYLADIDTTTALLRPFALYYWSGGQDTAKLIAHNQERFQPKDWIVSEFTKPSFSKDSKRLYFGTKPKPFLKDTTKLAEELAGVEVWSYTDKMLHTQQNVRLKQEKEKSYLAVYNTQNRQKIQLGKSDMPTVQTSNEGKGVFALAYDELPYLESVTWEGFPPYKDVYVVNVQTGLRKKIATKLKANPRMSPDGRFVYWYDFKKAAWFTHDMLGEGTKQITNNDKHPFYNETHDTPSLPRSYGLAAWTKGDKAMLIYDRYDIWKFDPNGKSEAVNLTKGRAEQLRHRYIRLDTEKRFLEKKENIMISLFDEKDKSSGYARLDIGRGTKTALVKGPFSYTTRPIKAKNTEDLVYTKTNMQTFPDLLFAPSGDLKRTTSISKLNPQQEEYSWGTIELVEWTDLNGNKLTGMLAKPEGFDPKKKYPMIVNFYEKSSDRLHRYHAPYPGRSTICYSFYLNRGYLIFNPDVPYREGYPGESALSAVTSGVASMIDKGFVDKERVGVQGHSWGGYQIAYLVTKTNMFKCAESGAPVVNMFSAYGGIRWGSGLSRQFQYEKTQSRIGGTIWEYPLRYLENSPLFFVDKIETPVLIMHNDKDGAVPWYQGIEFFTAMRRLNKPAWMLNYNGEPHWPVKRPNRVDFNIRMQQFFDYYLKDAPKPRWMDRGVPALEKGFEPGLELMKE